MRFGCCLNMVASRADGTGIEYLDSLAEAGYDYVELPLAQMMEMSEAEFDTVRAKLDHMAISCEVCNNFFPVHFRLTGPRVDDTNIIKYVDAALSRAARLGVSYVVFGSGPAKNVPEGFSIEEGYHQIVELLKRIDPIAARHQITIVIEPLRKKECNLINTFAEGCKLARDVEGEHVKVLVDFYHLSEEAEPVDHILKDGARYLRHVHFARPEGRVFPESADEADYRPFIQALKKINYRGRVSCEAFTECFKDSAPRALQFFKEMF